MTIDEEAFNLQCNIELRTSQLSRLLVMSNRQSFRSTNQIDLSEPPKDAVISGTKYGTSTLTVKNDGVSRFESMSPSVRKSSASGSSRSTAGGPKIKTGKPYCSLI